MNYGKFLFPLLIASSLTGCVVPQQSSDRISIAAVQKDIKVGMSSEEVVAILVFSFVNSLMYPGFEIPLHRACAI